MLGIFYELNFFYWAFKCCKSSQCLLCLCWHLLLTTFPLFHFFCCCGSPLTKSSKWAYTADQIFSPLHISLFRSSWPLLPPCHKSIINVFGEWRYYLHSEIKALYFFILPFSLFCAALVRSNILLKSWISLIFNIY